MKEYRASMLLFFIKQQLNIMVTSTKTQIQQVIDTLFKDSKNDYLKMMKGATKSIFRPIQPVDFKDVYLSISKDQGDYLVQLIKQYNLKNIVEFGTSFGISTLYLAQGALETEGYITTTELIASKANKAKENFIKAGVADLIDIRTGDAMETLKDYAQPIDLLLLDGWKDLYHPLFKMLEPNFHKDTIVYVDNANMTDTQIFLNAVKSKNKYDVEFIFGGKVALIRVV